MSYRIQVETSQPVWLSPTVDSALLKRPQDFTITLKKTVACFGDSTGKPGDVPCVIIRGIANIVSEDEFQHANLSYCDDTNWSFAWISDDKGAALKFSYSGGMPFEDTNDRAEYKFIWKDFYTSTKQKQASITAEAHNISGFTDETEDYEVQLAYPAYINSLAPNEYADGIIESDTGNSYIASAGSTFAFSWAIRADQTNEVVLKRNDKKIDYSDNNSYSETVSEDASFELTAKNGYPFSDIKTLTLQKTNWQKSPETIKDIDKIQDAFSLPSINRLMIWRKSYYLMVGKSLYTSTNLTAWTKLQDCPAGGASFSDYACGLYNGKIYVVAGGTGDTKYGINFNINSGIWGNAVGENIDIRYRFNSLVLSGYKSYYAGMNPGGGVFYDFDTTTSEVYDGGLMLHSNGSALACDACYWR
jgi:hypothetical protein